jgi:hypothetical protein
MKWAHRNGAGKFSCVPHERTARCVAEKRRRTLMFPLYLPRSRRPSGRPTAVAPVVCRGGIRPAPALTVDPSVPRGLREIRHRRPRWPTRSACFCARTRDPRGQPRRAPPARAPVLCCSDHVGPWPGFMSTRPHVSRHRRRRPRHKLLEWAWHPANGVARAHQDTKRPRAPPTRPVRRASEALSRVRICADPQAAP